MAGDTTRAHQRLRWLCRRGMKELDVCLTTWLERHPNLAPDQLQALEGLLQWQDDQLWDALRGAWKPDDALQQKILRELAQLAATGPAEGGS